MHVLDAVTFQVSGFAQRAEGTRNTGAEVGFPQPTPGPSQPVGFWQTLFMIGSYLSQVRW